MTTKKKPYSGPKKPASGLIKIICMADRLVLDDGTVLVEGQTAEVTELDADNYKSAGRAERA